MEADVSRGGVRIKGEELNAVGGGVLMVRGGP